MENLELTSKNVNWEFVEKSDINQPNINQPILENTQLQNNTNNPFKIEQDELNRRTIQNIYVQPKKIIVKMSHPDIGLGIFATEDIEKGELIERCPMIQLGWRNRYQGDPIIHKYCYTQGGCKCKDCQMHGVTSYMVLGYGMLYNHQDEPNTLWNFQFPNLIGDVVAVKDIKKDEEIFVSYGENYFSNRPKYILQR
jgi:hypothetical protein